MKCLVVLVAIGVLLLGLTGQSIAGVVIASNFGPDQSYLPDYYSVSGGGGGLGPPVGYGFAIAEAFIPTVNSIFGSLTLPMGITPDNGVSLPSGANAFTVSLMADNGGQPGTAIESFSLSNVPLYTSPALEHFTSTLNPILSAGVTYWIAVIPQERYTQGGWFINATGATGVSRTGNDGITWTASADLSAAYEVDGVIATPEPSTLTIAGVSAMLLLGSSWFRRRFVATRGSRSIVQ